MAKVRFKTVDEFIDDYKRLCKEKNNGNPITQLQSKILKCSYINSYFSRLKIDKYKLDNELFGRKLLCKLSPEETKNIYNDLCLKNNGPLSYADLRKNHEQLTNQIKSHFGGKIDLERILNIKSIQRSHTKETVEDEYKELCEQNGGRSMLEREIIESGKPYLIKAINTHWGRKCILDLKLGYTSANCYVTKNNSLVLSKYEVALANFLSHNNIEFKTNSLIKQKSDKMYKSDFKLVDLNNNEFHIELWGYSQLDIGKRAIAYNKKRVIKEKFYKDNNINFCGIHTKDLNSSYLKLQELYVKILLENKIIKNSNIFFLNREELYYSNIQTPDSVIKIYKDLCVNVNGSKLISHSKLVEMGYSWLSHYFQKYNSKQEVDIRLGFQHKLHYTKEEIKSEYHNICLSNGDKPCAVGMLKNVIYSHIKKYWKNKELLDIELGYEPFRTSYTYEEAKELYRQLCVENGNKAVSHGFLFKNGYETLYAQMQKCGGKRKIENELGLKNLFKTHTKGSIFKEYHQLYINNGYKFLKQSELTNSINCAISHHWGNKTNLENEIKKEFSVL